MDEKYKLERIGTPSHWRSFGFLVGIIFLLIGFWPAIWGHNIRLWSIGLGGALVLAGAIWPPALYWPYRIWMRIGLSLGWFNTRLILTLLFILVVTPIGLFKRMFGRDSLHLTPSKTDSYRTPRQPRDMNHMSGQF